MHIKSIPADAPDDCLFWTVGKLLHHLGNTNTASGACTKQASELVGSLCPLERLLRLYTLLRSG